ncbi:MAG: DUF3182 family protein [Burkholderiaceae bacterium]
MATAHPIAPSSAPFSAQLGAQLGAHLSALPHELPGWAALAPLADSQRRTAFLRCKPLPPGAWTQDLESKIALTRSVSALLGLPFAGDHGLADLPEGSFYVVPNDTLHGLALARQLGIHGPDDLLGGVVPHAFVATKVITHGLTHATAPAPTGWSHRFAHEAEGVVLPGFSAFSPGCALAAGERLLARGPVRLKASSGVGGRGQCVVADGAELKRRLAAIDPAVLADEGLVLELNLGAVRTLSVGQIRVGGLTASYHGVQHLTRDARGAEVYGGSSLRIVRGGFRELLAQPLDDAQRIAVTQALGYHDAALRCFSGMFASRSNYDVAQGTDEAGQWLSGVLEQSWRIGGASPAEIAALRVFQDRPEVTVVNASSHEAYGADAVAPAGAVVGYDGTDARHGRLLKYAVVDTYGCA